MCHIGTINQSHASLTLPEALTALRKLAISNPSLYKELTASTHNNTADEDTEPDYFAELEDSGVVDESDTPVDVAIEHIMMSRLSGEATLYCQGGCDVYLGILLSIGDLPVTSR
jgi:hypothetical protein